MEFRYHAFVTQDSKRRVTKEDQERMQELARQRQVWKLEKRFLSDASTWNIPLLF